MKTELGNRIVNWRRAQGMKQKDLALKLGISEPTLVNIERGKGNVGVDIYEKVLNYIENFAETR